MPIDDYNVNQSKVEGWQHITTTGGHAQITETFINDVAGILENLTTTGNIGRFFAIQEMLMDHISDKEHAPHGFNISYFKDELIRELYKAYKLNGGAGDIVDMYKAIFQAIPIVTHAEAVKGEEDTKAVNAPKFQLLFRKHSKDFESHYGALKSFMSDAAFNHTPTIALLSRYIDKQYYQEYFQPDGTFIYMVKEQEWNPFAGTIVVAFTHVEVTTKQILIDMRGGTKRYRVYIDTDNHLYVSRVGFGEALETVIFDFPLELPTGGNKKLVIAYNRNKIMARYSIGDMLSMDTKADINATIVNIPAPFHATEGKCRIREFIYYPICAESEDEMIFLLN